jgi:hypothetical protein
MRSTLIFVGWLSLAAMFGFFMAGLFSGRKIIKLQGIIASQKAEAVRLFKSMRGIGEGEKGRVV